ncbi:MAG: cell shape determination protein CcmA [Flavobacteriales bacterium]|nr:cell shape determination protein CcmA [Flavobacteriales bacterium]|tara:strand:+ start:2416 stop:2805 length:390 start_codon:yes stop_codon:yes gene_type:complete
MKKDDNGTVINMIGVGTIITGDVNSNGDLRIDGTLKGSVATEGKVVLGKNGVIEGDVVCNNADIAGEIKAKITVSQLLTLKSTAKLKGDIITNKLSIEPGAVFSGSCSMGAVIKDIKDVQRSEKKEKSA